MSEFCEEIIVGVGVFKVSLVRTDHTALIITQVHCTHKTSFVAFYSSRVPYCTV